MKKKIFSIALVLCLLASLICVPASAAISGDGSEQNPFLITCRDELEMLSDFPDCNFKLMNDIELVGNWTPVYPEFTGTFDGCGHTISNLTVTSYKSYKEGSETYCYMGFFSSIGKTGVVKHLNITSSETGVKHESSDCIRIIYAGGIAGRCYGKISQCSFTGNVYCSSRWGGSHDGYGGGIVGKLVSNGIIEQCYAKGKVAGDYAYGIAVNTTGNTVSIRDCYSMTDGMRGWVYECGIGNGATNCYFAGVRAKYPVGNNVTNCFYDKKVFGTDTTNYGTPKTTLAMQMKSTFVNAGWDFDTIWAIDEDYNDGYPYLQWERAEEPEPQPIIAEPEETSVSIVDARCTDDSIKFVSYAEIKETDTVSAFGTIFIPAWLFTSPDSSPVVIEYDAEEEPIKNGNTYGATLTDIPDGYQDMLFVAKSYLKLADGSYIWSKAKKASISEPTLRKVEE